MQAKGDGGLDTISVAGGYFLTFFLEALTIYEVFLFPDVPFSVPHTDLSWKRLGPDPQKKIQQAPLAESWDSSHLSACFSE